VDEVVLASHAWNPVLTKIKRNANFSVADWVTEQHAFWYPRLYEEKNPVYYDIFKDRPDFRYDETYPMDHLLTGYMDASEMEELKGLRTVVASERLGLAPSRIRTITHEDCHKYYAYFGSPIRDKALVLTAEGCGDYSNGTVSEFTPQAHTELTSMKENHLGHVYQYVTLLLGMKPVQHEYKVMGLAAYANDRELKRSLEVFQDVLKVDGLDVVFDRKPPDLYFHFRDALAGHRFDGIAGAAQEFLERILRRWVANCVAQTGLRQVVFAGGVAQNIKGCKIIAEQEGVSNLYVCPSAGDTSLSIGACYVAMWEYLNRTGGDFSRIQPLEHVFLGPGFTRDEMRAGLERADLGNGFTVREGVGPQQVASLLADGKIIARCAGRMEFGMRALGNRSILADPRRADAVRRINDAIKYRDFWMPFSPTILAERESDYLHNPKGLKCPHMTLAFDSTDRARRELIAALHPGDFTGRPQLLERRLNPDYYDLIKSFESVTGVGALLNTSFNLHGDPIVRGPDEALRTLKLSDVDGLLLEDFLIMR
jgi:carbamoyltransferase